MSDTTTVVDGAAKSIEPSTPKLADLIKDEGFAKQLQSYVDSEVGKGVTAFEKQGFAQKVEKEIEARMKARETKTPEQIKLDEMTAKLTEMQNKIAEKEIFEMRVKNKDIVRSELKDIPDELLEFLLIPMGKRQKRT